MDPSSAPSHLHRRARKISLHIASQTHGRQKPRPSRTLILHVVCAGVEPTRCSLLFPSCSFPPWEASPLLPPYLCWSANVVSQAGAAELGARPCASRRTVQKCENSVHGLGAVWIGRTARGLGVREASCFRGTGRAVQTARPPMQRHLRWGTYLRETRPWNAPAPPAPATRACAPLAP